LPLLTLVQAKELDRFKDGTIVSLVPSFTELLFDLGLVKQVIGITWFCIHPKEELKGITKIGGTKNVKVDVVKGLNPTLILANKEENQKEQIEELSKDFDVLLTDNKTFQDDLDTIKGIAQIFDKEAIGSEILNIKGRVFFKLSNALNGTFIYLIWKNPYMSAGMDTYINDLLQGLGLKNKIAKNRYPALTENEIAELNPEYIFLSSEPYPFKEKDILELQNLCPNSKILLVDGEVFSWYGSRLIHKVDYIEDFVNNLVN